MGIVRGKLSYVGIVCDTNRKNLQNFPDSNLKKYQTSACGKIIFKISGLLIKATHLVCLAQNWKSSRIFADCQQNLVYNGA